LPYRAPNLEIFTILISGEDVSAEADFWNTFEKMKKLRVLTIPYVQDLWAVIQSVKDLPDLQTSIFLPRQVSPDASAASVLLPPILLPDEKGEPVFLALKHFSNSANLRDLTCYFLLGYQTPAPPLLFGVSPEDGTESTPLRAGRVHRGFDGSESSFEGLKPEVRLLRPFLGTRTIQAYFGLVSFLPPIDHSGTFEESLSHEAGDQTPPPVQDNPFRLGRPHEGIA
jgi:hypothetical protein